jgi:hypothetical protein
VPLEIGTSYPHALRLETFDKMTADETSSSANQRRPHYDLRQYPL